MLIDSHAHLNFKAYKDDSDEVIQKALASSIWMINVGSEYKTSSRAVELTEEYKEGLYAAIGLHPIHVNQEEFIEKEYQELAKNPKVVAIGETGLDYYHITDEDSREKQKILLQQHLKLAKELNKPVIFHCRKAYDDLLGELSASTADLPQGDKLRAVVHCFSGKWSQAERLLEMGFYLGFTGVITYSRDYDKVIKNTPLEKILIETDCPYLTPEPIRSAQGKPQERNEPSYVKYVAEKIAEIKEISLEEVAKQTTNNAKKLFKIK